MFNFFLFFLINFFIRFRKHDLKVAFDGNFEFVSQILVSVQLMCIYAQYRPFLNDCLLSCQIVFQVIRKYALNKPWIMGFLMDIFGALLMLRALSLAPVSTLHCDICIKLPDCITFSGFGIFFFFFPGICYPTSFWLWTCYTFYIFPLLFEGNHECCWLVRNYFSRCWHYRYYWSLTNHLFHLLIV